MAARLEKPRVILVGVNLPVARPLSKLDTLYDSMISSSLSV